MSIYDGKIEPLPTQKKTLTEQLNNGTLKDGVYYIKDKDNDNILIGLRYSLTMTRLIDDGCSSFEVLDAMPSYDEYQALLSDQLAKQEGEEIIEELKVENKKLKEQIEEANRIILEDRGALEYCQKWGVK